VIATSLAIVSTRSTENIDHESEANDCTATSRALSIVLFASEEADCNGEDKKAISKEKTRP